MCFNKINFTKTAFSCDVTAARVSNVHVADIGSDYVIITWDALVPATGNNLVTYEARCADVDRLTNNHSANVVSSAAASSLSVLTRKTNATFTNLDVSAKYVITVSHHCLSCMIFNHHHHKHF